MKLSRILPLVGCMFTAVGILASTSPVHALTYNWSFVEQSNNPTVSGSGTFDLNSTGTMITDWNGSIGGSTTTILTSGSSLDGGSNDNAYPLTSNGVGFSTASINYNLWLYTNSGNPNPYELDLFDSSGNFNGSYVGAFTTNAPSSSSSSVPFNIPGGATIPTVGSLLALGAMRKARKSIASKTRRANPVVRVS